MPTRATLFSGKSGNKMLDTFNVERYSIMFTKTFKIVSPNFGSTGSAVSIDLLPSGLVKAGVSDAKLSRATRIVKLA